MNTQLFQEWQLLLVPFIVMIISQVVKVVLESYATGFQWRHLNSYGGMPSSHTALFVSLTLMIALVDGWDTPLFAAVAFITAVFVRDAFGIRWELGHHGKILNHLITTLPTDERKRFPKHLEERLGHTPAQVFAGGVLGVLLTFLFTIVING